MVIKALADMNNKITFYSKTEIVFFSILLTGFAGALMFGYNLRAVGKNKIVPPLLIIALFGAYAIRELLKTMIHGPFFILFISNIIVGLILAFPVWNLCLKEFPIYENKKPWIPVIVFIALYGGVYIFSVLRK